jgi:hypothetical protein
MLGSAELLAALSALVKVENVRNSDLPAGVDASSNVSMKRLQADLATKAAATDTPAAANADRVVADADVAKSCVMPNASSVHGVEPHYPTQATSSVVSVAKIQGGLYSQDLAMGGKPTAPGVSCLRNAKIPPAAHHSAYLQKVRNIASIDSMIQQQLGLEPNRQGPEAAETTVGAAASRLLSDSFVSAAADAERRRARVRPVSAPAGARHAMTDDSEARVKGISALREGHLLGGCSLGGNLIQGRLGGCTRSRLAVVKPCHVPVQQPGPRQRSQGPRREIAMRSRRRLLAGSSTPCLLTV